MTPTCVDQLPDDVAVLKQMVIEHQAALIGRHLQIERIEREAAGALAARDAAIDQIKSYNMHIFVLRRPPGLLLGSDVVFVEPPLR